MKLLVDMNLSPRLASLIQDAGIEAIHWSAVGAALATDVEIMVFARENGFIVLTHDLDFGAILAATNAEGPSVVQMRVADLTPELLAGPVLVALRQCESDLSRGALVVVEPARHRLRLLPLR